MERLLFGTAGSPLSSRSPSTEAGIERVGELGLGCMEVQFVQGVKMGERSARGVGGVASREGVMLSAHGPYFINLNAREPEKVMASKERIIQTARVSSLFGAISIVFHAAFYLEDPPDEVYLKVKRNLEEVMRGLREEGNRVWVRPEVTGKATQFGTLEEVLSLSSEVEGIAPCIDFAHLHARTGRFNSYEEFVSILEEVKRVLGRGALENMHIHVSGIEYTRAGERKHLPLRESNFQYIELLRALKDYGVKGFLICESPNKEEDSLLLKETFDSLS